jgi:hypothetical protein
MSDENVEMIRAGYAKHGMGFSLSKWNPDAVLELFDPLIEWVEPDVVGLPWHGTHRGPKAVADKVFATISAFEELELEPRDFVDLGEYVLVVGQGHLRAKATGKEWNGTFAHVWTVRNGKIVRWQGFADARRVADVFN